MKAGKIFIMNHKETTKENNKQQSAESVIAVNPNPAANSNIKKQLSEMNNTENQKARGSINSEITDGEDG
jgi:hypothetical protein